jgi:hypothetical protein
MPPNLSRTPGRCAIHVDAAAAAVDADALLSCCLAAVDASEFEPYSNQLPYTPGSSITIVALSRLVYRKGIDILALVIPEICHRHPHVNFIIGMHHSSVVTGVWQLRNQQPVHAQDARYNLFLGMRMCVAYTMKDFRICSRCSPCLQCPGCLCADMFV